MNTAIDVLAMLAGVAGAFFTYLSYQRSKAAGPAGPRRRPDLPLLFLGLLLLVAGVAGAALLVTNALRLPLLGTYGRSAGLALLGLSVCGLAIVRARDPMERHRSRDRALLANHLESQIALINARTQWEDRHYAELQATVETEDRPGLAGFLARLLWRSRDKRQVKSLTDALAKSPARLVLVEGNPGSGKSVALRHIALEMSRKAKRSRRAKSVIPVYVIPEGAGSVNPYEEGPLGVVCRSLRTGGQPSALDDPNGGAPAAQRERTTLGSSRADAGSTRRGTVTWVDGLLQVGC
jgi:hypothetical protein